MNSNTKILCYCSNCKNFINEDAKVCCSCNADLTKDGSKTLDVEISDSVKISESLSLKGKDENGRVVLKRRVDSDGTKHAIDVVKLDGKTKVFHSVWKDDKLIHHHKK